MFAFVCSTKYLGVTITSDLRSNKHADIISNKANRTIGFLTRNVKINSTVFKTTAYKVLAGTVYA